MTEESTPKPAAARESEPEDMSQAADSALTSADLEQEEQASIRDLLRGTLPAEDAVPADMLRGVQRKLRQRSRGKFYGDGWSTSKQPPVGTYLVTSLVMLAVLFLVWAVLSPLSGEPAQVEPPQPVNIIPPQR